MQSILRQNKNLEMFLILISVLSLAVFIIIGWPFDYYFQNDEFGHLPQAMQGKFIVNSLPRPLATFTLYSDYKIWGLKPFGYHITNLVLHVANCGLVYHFSFLLQSNEENVKLRKIKAFIASVIFLFYAFHSETIFWISGRGGSLAAFFVLLSLIFYLRRPKSNWNILFSLIFFLGGLLSYETSWIILFAIPIISYKRRNLRKDRTVILLFWLVFAFYIAWRLLRIGALGSAYIYGSSKSISLLLGNFNRLIARCFLPPMHSVTWFIVSYSVLLAFLFAYIIYCFRKRKTFCERKAIYLILFSIAPFTAISIGISIHDSEGERFIYVASIFLILLLVEILFDFFKKINYKIWLVLIAFIGIHIYFLIQSAQDYKTAGKMIKEILNCAKTSKINVQKLYIVNPPAQLRGALMFRNSFGPALKLFAPGLQFKELQVIQSVILQKGYKIECKKIAYQDMEGNLNQFGIYFNPQSDLVIWFTKKDVYFIQ